MYVLIYMYKLTCVTIEHKVHGLLWLRIYNTVSAADPQCPLSTCEAGVKSASLISYSYAGPVPAPTVKATLRRRSEHLLLDLR